MFQVTPAASSQVKEYFKGKETSPIRIFLNNGCGGPGLAMAVDEPLANDEVYEIEGMKYLIDKDLFQQAKPITIDFANVGFKIESPMKFESTGGCSGCAGSCH